MNKMIQLAVGGGGHPTPMPHSGHHSIPPFAIVIFCVLAVFVVVALIARWRRSQ